MQANINDRTTLIEVALITGLKVSSKSIPSSCEYPLATSLALCMSMVPSTFNLVFNTHLEQTTFMPLVLGISI